MTALTRVASIALALTFGLAAQNGRARGQDGPAPDAKTAAKGKADPAASGPAAKSKSASEKAAKTELATFGGGCFWSIETIFERVPGVKSVVSGFAGGNVPNPSYQLVCTGQTGHAEVVRVEYDPKEVSYDRLLKVFFGAHDPTTLDSQGDDFGPQYRSIIFYHSDDQKKAALKVYQDLTARRAFRQPIVTDLQPAGTFYPAETYHQDYFANNRHSEYSEFYIVPKLRKLRAKLQLK